MLRILHVVGARPNFMKAVPVHRALPARDGVHQVIVHTGQHYDANISSVFFRDLEIQEETTYLGIPCLTVRETLSGRLWFQSARTFWWGATCPACASETAIMAGRGKGGSRPELWDGHAGERIAGTVIA